jgi:hypothetical protein
VTCRLAHGEIIAFFVVLDNTLKRAVGHIGIPGVQRQQPRHDTAQAAVAVLERMDREKRHDKNLDDERVQPTDLADAIDLGEQLAHAARRVEHDAADL